MKDKKLEVYYKGKPVGVLAEMKDKRIAFRYSDDWLKAGFSVSPFSLPLKDEVFVPKPASREYFHGLFGVFADSLPDAWGELLLDRYLEKHGVRGISVLERLAYVGENGMGALEYYPPTPADFRNADMDYDLLARECTEILSSRPSDKLDILFGLGGSSGGTRPKILLEEDGRDWIVKFPSSRDPAFCGRREYDYAVCAGKCGIQMAETALIPSRICDGYFKTERFDRQDGNKIFCVTFAGLLEADYRAPSCDYSTYMKLVSILTKGNKNQLRQMYRLMCFNILTHNQDDHAKNFSFLYDENRGWYLAPAYDLTYSDTYFGEHTTSVSWKGKNFTENDLISVGVQAGLKKAECRSILQEIAEKTEDLDQYLRIGSSRGAGKLSLDERLKEMQRAFDS